mmetsp:Transcript_6165/g.12664  ORF Transcript_6165/g.12664 Transcript_6165/m.12664 type:complete len:234 (-) Transcript_6165:136-837(-)
MTMASCSSDTALTGTPHPTEHWSLGSGCLRSTTLFMSFAADLVMSGTQSSRNFWGAFWAQPPHLTHARNGPRPDVNRKMSWPLSQIWSLVIHSGTGQGGFGGRGRTRSSSAGASPAAGGRTRSCATGSSPATEPGLRPGSSSLPGPAAPPASAPREGAGGACLARSQRRHRRVEEGAAPALAQDSCSVSCRPAPAGPGGGAAGARASASRGCFGVLVSGGRAAAAEVWWALTA